MAAQQFVVRLAHPNGKFIGTCSRLQPPAAGDVIEAAGRRWRVVETPAGDDPRGGPTVVVLPA